MRLFSSIASDVAFVVAFVVILTLLPLVLTRLSYRVFPWSIEALLTRAFVLACAWSLFAAFRLAYALRLWDLCDRLTPARWCSLSTALHMVCDPCTDEAPGWWDWSVDCAGHACRTCDICRLKRGGRHLTCA